MIINWITGFISSLSNINCFIWWIYPDTEYLWSQPFVNDNVIYWADNVVRSFVFWHIWAVIWIWMYAPPKFQYKNKHIPYTYTFCICYRFLEILLTLWEVSLSHKQNTHFAFDPLQSFIYDIFQHYIHSNGLVMLHMYSAGSRIFFLLHKLGEHLPTWSPTKLALAIGILMSLFVWGLWTRLLWCKFALQPVLKTKENLKYLTSDFAN